jgi:hypothetical protein
MRAEQPVHLVDAQGSHQVVPLSDLLSTHVAPGVEAEVWGHEGGRLRRLARRPLDRKGFAFKVDVGSVQAFCATCYSVLGFAGDLQFGYFPHHRAGLLATASLDRGVYALGRTFQRHTFGLEAQLFPLSLWRLHLGGFGHGGWQIGKKENDKYQTGPAFGGGVILEFALTTRMTLMARADWTRANNAPEGGWVSSQIFTAGLAVY